LLIAVVLEGFLKLFFADIIFYLDFWSWIFGKLIGKEFEFILLVSNE